MYVCMDNDLDGTLKITVYTHKDRPRVSVHKLSSWLQG